MMYQVEIETVSMENNVLVPTETYLADNMETAREIAEDWIQYNTDYIFTEIDRDPQPNIYAGITAEDDYSTYDIVIYINKKEINPSLKRENMTYTIIGQKGNSVSTSVVVYGVKDTYKKAKDVVVSLEKRGISATIITSEINNDIEFEVAKFLR